MTNITTCAECEKTLFGPSDAPQLPARLGQRRILRWMCSTCAARAFTKQPGLAFSSVRVDLQAREVLNRVIRPWCYALVDPAS